MRADQLLVFRGLASTRSQAQRLIVNGLQWLRDEEWKTAHKNGDDIPENSEIRLLDDSEARFVSRGGLKLEAALKHVGYVLDGWKCLDIGQSTGGFTDCLLKSGAQCVVGVDVGSAQLHPQLRDDERVVCIEKTNARSLCVQDLSVAQALLGSQNQPTASLGVVSESIHPIEFDLIVIDLSFISQTLVLPAIVPFLKVGGHLISLVSQENNEVPDVDATVAATLIAQSSYAV